jgi:hypothetical protein
MKTMKKLILTLAAIAVLATPSFAQTPVFGHVGSDTAGSVAMLVKYIGSTAPGTTTDVAVAAGGDIAFRVVGVADTTVNTTGSIDCSSPPAGSDTMGEVVDLINASSNWRAVLVGALRSDSTDNTITTFTVANAARAEGLPLYFDSAVSLTTSIPLIPEACKTDIRCWMSPQGKLMEFPAQGTQTDVKWVEGYSTFATTGTFNIYSVKTRQIAGAAGSETASTIWSEVTAATGTNKQLTQFQYVGLKGKPNEKVIVRITDTGASSAFILHAYGLQSDVRVR